MSITFSGSSFSAQVMPDGCKHICHIVGGGEFGSTRQMRYLWIPLRGIDLAYFPAYGASRTFAGKYGPILGYTAKVAGWI
ncbi:Uncharacterised protein [Mycobacteroides abscessus subsp. bolletii]|nr:Uncharacterised protein [Mycobacteroides abscessus]SKE42746.1 Uncharacterised protein [Mycobacteroides abscessus subsp. bolletii]